MAIKNSNGTGGGFYDLAGSWAAGVPGAGDTFNILATDTITVRTAGGAFSVAGGTIVVGGGKLSIQSTAGFTITGNVAHNGTFEMLGSGSNVIPTLLTVNGCVWTCGVAAIWNVVGTLNYATPDVKIVGNATSQFDFVLRSGISGTITKCEFNTFGIATGLLFRIFSYTGSALTISDLLFKNLVARGFGSGTCSLSGTIYFNGCAGTTAAAAQNFLGNAIILVENSTAATNGGFNNCNFSESIYLNINEKAGGSRISNVSVFSGNSTLRILDVDANTTFSNVTFTDNAIVILATTTNSRTFLITSNISTSGKITISGQNALTCYQSNIYLSAINLEITVLTGIVTLTNVVSSQNYFQASRIRNFAIVGSTGITLNGATTTSPQYEPVLYKYNLVTYLFAIQYDMTNGCPNYTALYGTSVLWTPATKTLAAGGSLIINSTGHTANGMDMAIQSLAGFALATSGTAVINTAAYYISFDGGVLWSAALTLAQLQSNSYIINGNTYNTDPRYNIQLRISLTSNLGGTVTQVVITGITYNPAVTSDWDVRGTLNAIEGAGFVTGTDDLRSIRILISALGVIAGGIATVLAGITSLANWLRGLFRKDAMNAVAKGEVNAGGGNYDEATDSNEATSDKIGVPVPLDGGLSTISSNLTKMADDAGGAQFDSTTDSLHSLGTAIAAIAAAIAALLAPIMKGVQWLIMAFRRTFGNKINNG